MLERSFLGFSLANYVTVAAATLVAQAGCGVLIAVGIAGWGVSESRRAEATATWPSAEGRILESETVQVSLAPGLTAEEPYIAYGYRVGNRDFVGWVDEAVEGSARAEVTAPPGSEPARVTGRTLLERYPVGHRLAVYYDPREPSVSTIRPGGVDFGSDALLVAGGVMALALLAFAAGVVLRRWSRPALALTATGRSAGVFGLRLALGPRALAGHAIIVGVLVGMTGLVVAAFAGLQLDASQDSRNWPSTPGQVSRSDVVVETTSSGVGPDAGSPMTVYGYDVRYRYSVAGSEHEGRRVRTGENGVRSGNPAFARRTTTAYPVGRALDVYYDPADPGSSLLEQGAGDMVYLWLFLAGMLGLGAIASLTVGFLLKSWLDIAREDATSAVRGPPAPVWVSGILGVAILIAALAMVEDGRDGLFLGFVGAVLAGLLALDLKAILPLDSLTGRGQRDKVLFALVGAPLILLLAMGLWGDERATALVSAGLVGLFLVLLAATRSGINRRATGTPDHEPAVPTEPSSDSTVMGPLPDVVLTEDVVERSPFTLRLFTTRRLPDASDEARNRLESAIGRGAAVRRLYRRAVLLLSGGVTTVSAVWAFAYLESPFGYLAFGLLAVFFFATSALLLLDRARGLGPTIISRLAGYLLGVQIRFENAGWRRETAPVRPLVVPMAGGAWLFVALMISPFYAWGANGVAAAAALYFLAVAYVLWIRVARADLEKRRPLAPPLDMLALRVFDSPYLEDFLDLTDRWQWLGTRQRLDGPATTGKNARDLVNFVRGRLADSVVETTEELNEALGEFSREPDSQMRYPVNSMQCGAATWKEALDHLLAQVHVVVMDLSGFSEENSGCRYEIRRLFDRVPLERVVFLVNHATDFDTLVGVLGESAETMSDASPNRRGSPEINLFDVRGAIDDTLEEEVSERALVALLCSRALDASSARNEAHAEPTIVRWARPHVPGWAVTLRVAALGFLAFFSLALTTCAGIA